MICVDADAGHGLQSSKLLVFIVDGQGVAWPVLGAKVMSRQWLFTSSLLGLVFIRGVYGLCLLNEI